MSIVARSELEKERRRNDILNAAEKLFFSKGYESVSLKDIAKEAKLGRSTLYLYFENKEELFFAIVLRGALILNATIKKEVKTSKTAVEKLARFRAGYYKFADKYPDYLKAYNYLLSGRFDLANIESSEYRWQLPGDHSKFYNEFKKNFEENYLKLLEQGTIPNFPIPKFTVSEYLNEIIVIRREMLDILIDAIRQGKKEKTVRNDVNPVEATVILTMIANGIDNMPPDLEDLLESQGIGYDKFLMDVGNLIGYMISNRIDTKKKE